MTRPGKWRERLAVAVPRKRDLVVHRAPELDVDVVSEPAVPIEGGPAVDVQVKVAGAGAKTSEISVRVLVDRKLHAAATSEGRAGALTPGPDDPAALRTWSLGAGDRKYELRLVQSGMSVALQERALAATGAAAWRDVARAGLPFGHVARLAK